MQAPRATAGEQRAAGARAEFIAGARAELPLLLGVAPFGMAYGATAVEEGLPSGLAQAMSAIVFGGASQFVAVRQIADDVPAAIIVLSVLLVNLRHLLYSASVAPYVAHVSRGWRMLLAYLLTDEAYAAGIGRLREGERAPMRHWYLLGAGVALWVSWQVTTAAGVFVGAAVPESWSLDFALPATFIAIVVPALRDRPALAAAAVAGGVALAAHDLPDGTGLIAAAAAGIAAGVAASSILGARAGAAS